MSWSYYLRINSSTSWAYSSRKSFFKFVSTVLYHRSSAILDFYGGYRRLLVPRLPLPAPRSPLPVPRFSNIQKKYIKLTQYSVSFSCQSKQDSRCCINFPHELTCQILTNQSIKIGSRAWPTRDHGVQSQEQLSFLPVIAGWIFASEVSFKSKS